MAVFPQLERFIWFNSRLKRQRFPNASHLAKRFEISRKTAQRDIALLRDRLEAPLAYDHLRKGYYYTDDGFELFRMAIMQQDVLSVLIARRLLSRTAGGPVSEAICGLHGRVPGTVAVWDIDEERLEESFSAYWHGFSPVSDEVFRTVAEAMLERCPIEIRYHSPGSGANTRRIVEPHHLQHYMASWVLIAYCRLRKAWRKFYLSRIDGLGILPGAFDMRPREEWTPLIEGAFGIFQGDATVPVSLRFNAFRARWIREQHWHPEQRIRETPDGGIEISFPVADFREVKMMVLQFGADVHVLAPEALRDEIRKEVSRMRDLYGT